MQNGYAEYHISVEINNKSVDVEVAEVLLERNWGVERWGVGVGRDGKLLDYFEYARQRDEVTAVYHPVVVTRPMPTVVASAVIARIRDVATERHAQERARNV